METIAQIENMLEQGISQREVARLLRVGRNQVREIARGNRPDYEKRRQRPKERAIRPLIDPVRCQECGALVFAPCVHCELKRRLAKQNKRIRIRDLPTSELTLGVDLKEDDFRRYLEVRRCKQSDVVVISCGSDPPRFGREESEPSDGALQHQPFFKLKGKYDGIHG
jgi:hypothetical protein